MRHIIEKKKETLMSIKLLSRKLTDNVITTKKRKKKIKRQIDSVTEYMKNATLKT